MQPDAGSLYLDALRELERREAEVLRRRDRLRWHLEHDAEARARQEEERRDREEQQRDGSR
jgi:hypothetical protein